MVELAANEPALSDSLSGDIAWRCSLAEFSGALTDAPVDAIVFHVEVHDHNRLFEALDHASALRPSTKLLLAATSSNALILAEIDSTLLRHRTRSRRAMLTARESQVLQEIRAGRTNREIASLLGISLSTVNRHVENILKRLSARNRAQAVAETLATDYDADSAPTGRRVSVG